MINLDDVKLIKQKDPKNVLGSIELLASQCQQAWQEVNLLKIPSEYTKIKRIVFSGMGGSALGAYVIKDLFFKDLKVPFEIVNDYHLPQYADKDSLVVLGSYSGTTEETVNAVYEAVKKRARAFIITTDGDLSIIAKKHKIPAYIFIPKFNPSGQPRLGTGYSIFSQLALLNILKIVKISIEDINETIKILKQGNKSFGIHIPTTQNNAKQLALNLLDKIPIIIVAQHLTGVGRVIRNQLHESAKNFADYYPLPELNHHLMESLGFPGQNTKTLSFVFLLSKSYSEKILKRIEITKEVINKNKIKINSFTTNAQSNLAQVFQCIQFGAYMNYYLGMLNGVDPSKIPWVDYFKRRLRS